MEFIVLCKFVDEESIQDLTSSTFFVLHVLLHRAIDLQRIQTGTTVPD